MPQIFKIAVQTEQGQSAGPARQAITRRPALWLFAVGLAASLSLSAHQGETHGNDNGTTPIVLAPGYEKLDFPAPQPGSYNLPVLGLAGDGELLDSNATELNLHTALDNKITVLSFIYQACDDVNGCPLATYVMHQVRQKLESDPALASQVQLLSVSFDPENDTPESMRAYQQSFGSSPVAWRFLTARSTQALAPLLEDYGQSLSRQPAGSETASEPGTESGAESGTESGAESETESETKSETKSETSSDSINHVLRVFLIDEHKQIRNIFSSSLLHADTLLSDIQTLVMNQTALITNASENAGKNTDENSDIDTVSVKPSANSLEQAAENLQAAPQSADTTAALLAVAQSPSLGLPALPGSDALTENSIRLGRQLFFDRRLSINDTFSCAMCHIPEQGFTVNEIATAVGVEGRTVKRNAPTLLNVGYLNRLFHDGRESKLEQQVWSPLLAHNEMANPSIGYILDKIAAIEEYRELFQQAFDTPDPDMQTLGIALSDYQRSLVAGDSDFDRWYFGKDATAVSNQVKDGFAIFTGKAGCTSCHLVDNNDALFTDQQLHNTGIGYARSMNPTRSEPHPVTLAPGVVVMVDPAVYAAAAEKPPNDLGLYEISQNPHDRWRFRTPGLRNVALTAPYMHDGSLATLEAVIDFYIEGGIANSLLSPAIKPFSLDSSERAALLAFLESLTSNQLPLLLEDAASVAIGNPRLSDPHWSRVNQY